EVVVVDMDLEAGDSWRRARGCTDLRGKIRQGRKVVPEHGRLARKAPAGQLHAVAGVASEADDDAVDLLDRLGLLGHRRRYSALSRLRRRRAERMARSRSARGAPAGTGTRGWQSLKPLRGRKPAQIRLPKPSGIFGA